jgi:hypothetical protein
LAVVLRLAGKSDPLASSALNAVLVSQVLPAAGAAA